jgi:Response regulator receiver domain
MAPGLRMLLEAEPDITVAGEAGTGTQAIAAARRLDPDVVLMDVRMPGMDGIEATAQLVRVGSSARILMLTTEWVWVAGGGGHPDGPHHQCPLAGTDVPAYQPGADVASGKAAAGCREIVGGVCRLSRRVSGYR